MRNFLNNLALNHPIAFNILCFICGYLTVSGIISLFTYFM